MQVPGQWHATAYRNASQRLAIVDGRTAPTRLRKALRGTS
jgi:hypothetical protein